MERRELESPLGLRVAFLNRNLECVNSPAIRARICAYCAWLGVLIDEDANRDHRGRIDARIDAKTSGVATYVIPTDEERMIADHTARVMAHTG